METLALNIIVYCAAVVAILDAVRRLAAYIARGSLFRQLLERIIDNGSADFLDSWNVLRLLLDYLYGPRYVSLRALIVSICISSSFMATFILLVLWYFSDVSPIEWVQFLIAAVILNFLGDFASLLQTRLFLDWGIRRGARRAILAFILDIVASILIFCILYFIVISINMIIVGNQERVVDVALRSARDNIDFESPVSSIFIGFSLASCMASTIIHLIYLFAFELYISFAKLSYSRSDIKSDLEKHFVGGCVFMTFVFIIVVTLLSVAL